MTLTRRDLLNAGASASLIAALPRSAAGQQPFTPRSDVWRNFEMVTRVELVKGQGAGSQAWIPVPSLNEPEWIRPAQNTWPLGATNMNG